MSKSSLNVNKNKKLKITLIVRLVIIFLVIFGVEASKNYPPANQHSWIYNQYIMGR